MTVKVFSPAMKSPATVTIEEPLRSSSPSMPSTPLVPLVPLLPAGPAGPCSPCSPCMPRPYGEPVEIVTAAIPAQSPFIPVDAKIVVGAVAPASPDPIPIVLLPGFE